jgi:alanyl-tRNA synthetase
MAGFEEAMAGQRQRARAASHFGAAQGISLDLEGGCEFVGYDRLEQRATLRALFQEGQPRERLSAGESGMVVLDRTPFYAESGGQVGDKGLLRLGDAEFQVQDTRKQAGDLVVHYGQVRRGELRAGAEVDAEVDGALRAATALNHSATHLLHAALRRVLGEHVSQKGSLVDPERLRFDFSHFEPITQAQLQEIERLVNTQIRVNHPVETRVTSLAEAKAAGAMALFGEKYGDQVRVLRMGDFSTELCGGTHVRAAGDIGLFRIIAETGIAAGVRRIEALTGARAVELMEQEADTLRRIADLVHGDRAQVDERVNQVLDRNRKLEKEVEQLKLKLASGVGADLAAQAKEVAGVKVLAARLEGGDAKTLRDTLDQLKDKLGSAVILLAAVAGDRVNLAAGVTKDLTGKLPAGQLINAVADKVGGRGGGRPDLAQAGGNRPEGLDDALAQVEPWVRERLGA